MTDAGGGPYIEDMTPGGEVAGTYGVAGKRLRSFRDPSRGRFLQLRLRDVTGSIAGLLWEGAEEVAESFSVGDVLRVRGQVEEYRGQKQLVLQSLDPSPAESVRPERFIPPSPRSLDEMERELWRRVEMVEDPHLSQLLLILFQEEETYSSFITAPAGKTVHHNYLHGLLEHSLEVVSILTREDCTDEMDTDLLITGGLLHDVGKIEEYFCRAAIGYTDEGRLLGHIVMGDAMLRKALRRVPDISRRRALHLRHLLLSHHGKQEYGSPVLPQTPEAVALHHADLYSGRVGQVRIVADGAAESGGDWSEFDPMLGRYVWVASEKEAGQADE